MPYALSLSRRSLVLPAIPRPELYTIAFDCDLDRHQEVIAVVQAHHGVDVYFRSMDVVSAVKRRMRYPQIRSAGDFAALLFERRSEPREVNAFVISADGTMHAEFPIGDALSDVVWTEQAIVAGYFDEGVFGKDSLAQNGIAVFDHTGNVRWGWNRQKSLALPEVYDCYAMAVAADRPCAIGAIIYTRYRGEAWAFIMLDLETMGARVYEVPEILNRTKAITATTDGVWLFAVRTDDGQSIVAWRPGEVLYTSVRTPIALRRGVGHGRFIGFGDETAEIVEVAIDDA